VIESPTLVDQIPALQPLDEHNRALAANVHPPDWVNPVPAARYNLVVIGAGTAGLVAAAGAAGLGAKVALIERDLMGGDCLNVGCVPSKALIRCARAAADVRDADQFGVRGRVSGDVTVDFPSVMERMRRLRAEISPHDSVRRFRDLGIDVFLGSASFVDRQSVRVGDHVLRFSRAVIATGARASAPPIPGLKEAGYLTNETVFSLTELPARLAVIGAGPLGCELAQAFARFGSEVTLIESEPRIMPREDADAAAIVEQSLKRDGIRIVCGGKAAKVSNGQASNEKIIAVECEGQKIDVHINQILIGVGRQPNVEGLNLEAAAVEYDAKAGVKVNDYLQTRNPHIYAAGDSCSASGGLKFTHLSDAHARIVIQNALFFGRAKASRLVIPWCTYTDPEVAHVGMDEAEAKKRNINTHTIKIDLDTVDRAILDGESPPEGGGGFLKVMLRKGTDKILGATLVSSHAGETISELTTAITHGIGLRKLASVIHAYPTQAEVIKRAADAYNRTRLTPRVKKIFERVLAWRR
jgi:pyruvate/2-oxoglutarate dehydrogenase complex dihydrolipoamide dehydrogenase (E3) component